MRPIDESGAPLLFPPTPPACRASLGPRSKFLTIHSGAHSSVQISAPTEDWERMLAPVPRPFNQDLFGAQLHHDVELNRDPLDYAAYYPALRRLVEILREARSH